ncbi:hypothetical protein [Paraburkholderia diazotrophica]|uniref:hypothetical protein n=1 Tax=Paraburkholderia diazotrophica TaxID=667676 RepID=UPI00317F1FF7
MPPLNEDDDFTVIMRFLRAVALVVLALATLAMTVAMFWRDMGIASFFDDWFGQWSEGKLTTVAGVMAIVSIVALRVTQKSEDRYRQRSRIR